MRKQAIKFMCKYNLFLRGRTWQDQEEIIKKVSNDLAIIAVKYWLVGMLTSSVMIIVYRLISGV